MKCPHCNQEIDINPGPIREPGFKCPKCDSLDIMLSVDRTVFECRDCRHHGYRNLLIPINPTIISPCKIQNLTPEQSKHVQEIAIKYGFKQWAYSKLEAIHLDKGNVILDEDKEISHILWGGFEKKPYPELTYEQFIALYDHK